MEWSDRVGRRIKLRDLHILLAVAESKSMARAADLLAVSQPVVSKVVADLERVIGVRLFDRDRHGAEPTTYGRALLMRGVTVFDELKQGLEEIEFLRDPGAGELRIAAHSPTMQGILPLIVDRLRHRYPKLLFDITEAENVPTFWQTLRERNVDLVIGRVPSLSDDLDVEVLFDDAQHVVAGARSRWAQRRKIELRELINEPWILPKPNGSAGTLIAATFAASGLQLPRPEVTCGSFPMMNALLARGPMLAFWPISVLRLGTRNFSVNVLPVKLPRLPRPVGIITLKGRTISPAARVFIECARGVAKPLMTRGLTARNSAGR